jgi:acyl carrier protein
MTPQADANHQIRATVLQCWCETLGLTEDEVTDSSNFFDDGNSVLAIQFLSAVRSALGLETPVDPLFLDGTFGAFVRAAVDTASPVGAWKLNNAS